MSNKTNDKEPCAVFTAKDKSGKAEYKVMLINYDEKNEEDNISKFMNMCYFMAQSN